MRRILCFVLICMIGQVVSKNVSAQNTAVYEGLTYYLDKQEAFDAATAQDKQVFMFWGSNSCGVCSRVKKNLAVEAVKSLLDEHYILWFCDALVYRWDSPIVSDYISDNLPYPGLCVIDPADVTKGYGLTNGYQNVETLQEMLDNYADVANDHVGFEGVRNAYISQNNLMVNGGAINEDVSIYSITGSLVDQFRKTAYSAMRDASSYPAGVLIVTGSSGWAQKVVMK